MVLNQGAGHLGFKDLKNVSEPLHAYGISLGGHVGTPGLVMKEGPAPTDQVPIAVLPFANMSGDPDQEYFSDGITEDIITELSRFKNLFVIARNSSFHYKGQSPKIQDVGRDLGIQYIVEGSVRKVRNRVRVTAQLTETERGSHLWAERYDRDLEDIFAVQDELVREIAATVPGQLDAVAAQRARHRSIENLTAYDYLLRGEWLAREDLGSREALALFEKAIEIDPHIARAYTRLAVLHAYSVFSHGIPVQTATQMAQSFSQRALEIDPTDPTNHAIVAEAYILVGEHDLARHHIDRAIKLNPNDYNVMINAGRVLAYLGETGEGLQWLNKLKRHDPFYGDACREAFFDLFYMCRDYQAAIAMFRGWRDPPWQMYSERAAAYAQLGLMDESHTAMTTWERMRPKVYDPVAEIHAHARMCARPEDRENWLEGYRKAGFKV